MLRSYDTYWYRMVYEDEDASSISSTDLLPELKVVWNSEKGERQDVAIVNIHDEKPRKPAPLKRQREDEDSSDSTSDEVQPKPKSETNQNPITIDEDKENTPEQVTTITKTKSINTTLLELKQMWLSASDTKSTIPAHAPRVITNAEDVKHFTTKNGVNLLAIPATEPSKYARRLMQSLFTDEKISKSLPYKKKSDQCEKLNLSPKRVALIEECIEVKFGKGTMSCKGNDIITSCNQKCLDILKKVRGNPK
eukprot:Em0003g1690a